MNKEKQFTQHEKKLFITIGAIGVICVTVSTFLNVMGGSDYQHPVVQALGLTVAQIFVVWLISFFPIFPNEPRFPQRWRRAVATAIGLVSILLGYFLSLLVVNTHSMLIEIGPLAGSTPTLLFRIIEMWQTGREKERQGAM